MARWQTPIHAELHRGLRDAVGGKTASQFARLGIHTIGDLMRHTPRRYIPGAEMSDFTTLRVGEEAAIVAKVVRTSAVQGSRPRVEATLTDGNGYLTATFFGSHKKKHLTAWWMKLLQSGSRGLLHLLCASDPAKFHHIEARP